MKQQQVLSTSFNFISYADAFETIEEWRQAARREYVAFTPPYSVMLSMQDSLLADANRGASLVLPDGVGIILAAKILGYTNSGRVSGPTLMLKACDWGRQRGYRHYLYGGAPGTADTLRERLSAKYPGLHVVGTYAPPFRKLSEEEDQAIVHAINATKPDIVWVGLGSPKQEVWMREHVGKIDAAALIGVGAAFDFHSGRVKWAPAFMRKAGLEWAYRLIREPRRLWRRSLESPRFVFRVIRQRLARPKYSPSIGLLRTRDTVGADRHSFSGKTVLAQDAFSVDVEEWFHILNATHVPTQEQWASLETRVERNVDKILALLDDYGIHATFFWLGWVAERHRTLLRRCSDLGHEVASHGYSHVQPLRVGPTSFRDDVQKAKKTIEDIIGKQVGGFRTAGFGVDNTTAWIFDIIEEAGHQYDSSIFLARGGGSNSCGTPYVIHTRTGPLVEIPIPAIQVFGLPLFMFGGGYLRLAPEWLVRWGVRRLHAGGSPLVLYVHPREVDCEHSGLKLGFLRQYRHYGNAATTIPKLAWLLQNNTFATLGELACRAGNGQQPMTGSLSRVSYGGG